MTQHGDLRGNLEEEFLYYTNELKEKCQTFWIQMIQAPDILGEAKI